MIYDPLAIVLRPISWWAFLLIYAVFDIVLNLTFCYLFGKKQRVIEFFRDPLSILWPFFVLGSITGGYIYITDLLENIQNGFSEIGRAYEAFSTSFPSRHLFWIIILMSIGLSISTRMRYEKHRPNIWFNKPKLFGRTRTALVDFPMAYMAIMILIKLFDQWYAINNFLLSKWLPDIPFHIDNLYGIHWVYDIVVTQITIALIISLGPLIMMTREGKQKYSWIYKTLFSVGAIIIIFASLLLAGNLGHKITAIYKHFASTYIIFLSSPDAKASLDTNILLKQLIFNAQLDRLLTLPQKLILPAWLENLIGFRLVVFLIVEIYPTLASKFSLPKSSPLLEKLLDKISK